MLKIYTNEGEKIVCLVDVDKSQFKDFEDWDNFISQHYTDLENELLCECPFEGWWINEEDNMEICEEKTLAEYIQSNKDWAAQFLKEG